MSVDFLNKCLKDVTDRMTADELKWGPDHPEVLLVDNRVIQGLWNPP